VLRTRVWTGLIALTAVLAVVTLASNSIFTLFIAALTAWALYENAQMFAPARLPLVALLALVGAAPALLIFAGDIPDGLVPSVIIAAMTGLTLEVAFEGGGAANYWMTAVLGSLYVGVLTPYFAVLRNEPRGVQLIIVMLLLIVAGDTGAFLIGRKWGRTKLAPHVSPGKTVEGSIASLAASLIAMAVLRGFLNLRETLVHGLVLALAINLLAQVGDLAESALKRVAGVKDSGWLFPGHGGLLDRTDSLVFATVFTYYYSR
jgi:phosphatidate cytidylyltransferase